MAVQADPNLIAVVTQPGDMDAALIKSTLAKAGFEVVLCASEREAKELSKNKQPLRLIIADAATANERISELVSPRSDIPVLVLASPNMPERSPGWKNIQGYLKRPFRRARVLGSVLEVLGRPLVRTA